MHRRQFLAATTAAGVSAFAGCSGDRVFDTGGGSEPVVAKRPDVEWQLGLGSEGYGEPSFKVGEAAIQPGAGGYLVAGIKTGDAWLLRLDAEGARTWEQVYGGSSGRDNARDVIQLGDGGYLFTGRTTATSTPSAWLVRTGREGRSKWQRAYGGDGDDEGNAVAAAPDGGYVFAGSKSGSGSGGRDAWLVKVDDAGEVAWQRTYDIDELDRAADVLATDDGYVVVGSTREGVATDKNGWVIGTDRSGRERWRREFAPDGINGVSAVVAGHDGGIVVAGLMKSFAWVAKLDSGGQGQWEQQYGGDGSEEASELVRTSKGYAFAGSTTSFGAGGRDGWLAEIDKQGEELWNQSHGEDTDELANALLSTREDGFFIAGTRRFNIGDKNAGRIDFWASKLGTSSYSSES